MTGDKVLIRQQVLAQRQNFSKSIEAQWNQKICQHLGDFLDRHVVDNHDSEPVILAYWPYRREPDLSSLLQIDRYSWALPRCLPDRQLGWHVWQWGDPLVTNSYGLAEPASISPVTSIDRVAVLLIPAVAIDERGYRLGYGGGYFDRLLSHHHWQQIMTIGVVFDFAYVPRLPVDDWDRPLAAVCTESGMVIF
jgi:5-formyltetrahydrofolate cyclo-ligase